MPGQRKGWRAAWLAAYEQTLNVSAACRAAGVSRATAYRTRARRPRFAERWDELKQWALDDLEAAAFERALAGSDRLLIFLLENLRPERYGRQRRTTVEIKSSRNVRDSMTPKEKAELESMTLEELEAEIDKHLLN